MKGADQYFLGLIGTPQTRFVIPIFQRNYSWNILHCMQLFNDIRAVGESSRPAHFSGSVVWVDAPRVPAGTTPLLLIDGQQRTTTVTLLLLALAEYSRDHDGMSDNGTPLEFGFEEVLNTYVVDPYRKGEDRYRLSLSENDDATLKHVIEKVAGTKLFPLPEHPSESILENFDYLRRRVNTVSDQNVIWRGLKRLQIISVRLDADDNPQLVFESMNSTGKSLTAGDLIRNFILMGLPFDEQTRLYTSYWRPMEKLFRNDDEKFNSFMRNYLTIFFTLLPNASEDLYGWVRLGDIYSRFKQMVLLSSDLTTESLMKELIEAAKLYTNLVFAEMDSGTEENPDVQKSLRNLCSLGYTVDEPIVLQLLLARQHGVISAGDLVRVLNMIESYLVRRVIAGYATNSLNKFFAAFIRRIDAFTERAKADPKFNFVRAFAATLTAETDSPRAFPSDEEVRSSLQTLRFYHKQKAGYILLRLENEYHPKTPFPPNIFTEKVATIEHILPQQPHGIPEWDAILGENPDETLQQWLHNLGNLTLTGYNSELQNGSFAEKKERMIGGYAHDRFSLSSDVLSLDQWTIESIEKRCKKLTRRILEVWPFPMV